MELVVASVSENGWNGLSDEGADGAVPPARNRRTDERTDMSSTDNTALSLASHAAAL